LDRVDYVIKLGGSAITNKDTPLSPNTEVIEGIAKELANLQCRKRIVLVYGGGSYGHFVARGYLKNGKISNPKGIAETRSAMLTLAKKLTDVFLPQGIPIFCINPSSCFILKNGEPEPKAFFLKLVSKALGAGLVPAIGGDIVLDKECNARVLSGDTIARMLAAELNAKALLFGSDVDGILSNNKVVKEISKEEMRHMQSKVGNRKGDVTGGMAGKLKEIDKYLSQGGELSVVFNLTKPGVLTKILKGQYVEATYIRLRHKGVG
jgi:isopentenyl phosphate kinase